MDMVVSGEEESVAAYERFLELANPNMLIFWTMNRISLINSTVPCQHPKHQPSQLARFSSTCHVVKILRTLLHNALCHEYLFTASIACFSALHQ